MFSPGCVIRQRGKHDASVLNGTRCLSDRDRKLHSTQSGPFGVLRTWLDTSSLSCCFVSFISPWVFFSFPSILCLPHAQPTYMLSHCLRLSIPCLFLFQFCSPVLPALDSVPPSRPGPHPCFKCLPELLSFDTPFRRSQVSVYTRR